MKNCPIKPLELSLDGLELGLELGLSDMWYLPSAN